MRTPPSTRLAALLLGLLYLLAWGEPAAWHPCPMHDGVGMVAGTAVGAPSHADAAAAHGDHGPAHDAVAPASAVASDAGHDEDHACQCLGSGCCPGGVLAPTAQAVRWRVVVARRADPPAPEPAALQAAAPRLLPYANGPPALT